VRPPRQPLTGHSCKGCIATLSEVTTSVSQGTVGYLETLHQAAEGLSSLSGPGSHDGGSG
jgi:hypothetical protein